MCFAVQCMHANFRYELSPDTRLKRSLYQTVSVIRVLGKPTQACTLSGTVFLLLLLFSIQFIQKTLMIPQGAVLLLFFVVVVVVVFNSVQLKNKTKQKTNFIPQGAILLLLLLLFLLSFVCLFVFVCFTCDLFVHLFPAEPLAHD